MLPQHCSKWFNTFLIESVSSWILLGKLKHLHSYHERCHSLLHLLSMTGQAGVYDLACTWVLNSGNFSAREQEVQTTYCITEEYWAKKNWDYSSNQTVYWKCYFIRFHKTSIKASRTDASGLLLQHIFIWVSFKTGHCSVWIKSVLPHGHYILHYPFPPQNPYPKESVWFSSLDAGESWPKGPHILLSSKN